MKKKKKKERKKINKRKNIKKKFIGKDQNKWTKKGLWSMRWIWLKRASKYLCVESDQKGPLIYALNLTEN